MTPATADVMNSAPTDVLPDVITSAAAPRTHVDLPHAHVASTALDAVASLLDDVHARLVAGAVGEPLTRLVPALRAAREATEPEAWTAFCQARCLTHPVAAVLREDPFTHRAHAKPRGYPGDAALLDLIYGATPLPPDTTALGRALYASNVHSDACRSVRERRAILADAIDAAGARAPGRARVLSVACGHLREAQCSAAVRDGAIASFHALDQDPLSIALLQAEHAPLGVTPVVGTVGDVLRGRARFAPLELAYAAGLYDYLPAPLAARLTARLFALLAPGGRLIVANFCPELVDVGYMEAFMDWRLIYRDEHALAALAVEVPGAEIARQRVFRDTVGAVAYLEIERA